MKYNVLHNVNKIALFQTHSSISVNLYLGYLSIEQN